MPLHTQLMAAVLSSVASLEVKDSPSSISASSVGVRPPPPPPAAVAVASSPSGSGGEIPGADVLALLGRALLKSVGSDSGNGHGGSRGGVVGMVNDCEDDSEALGDLVMQLVGELRTPAGRSASF